MTEPQDPQSVFKAYVAAVNSGQIGDVMDLFDPNVEASPMVRQAYRQDGGDDWAAIKAYIESAVINNDGEIKIVRIATVGDWVYGVHEVRSKFVAGLGISRLRGIDEVQVKNGKITSFRVILDPSDTDTAKMLRSVLGSLPS